MKKKKSNWQHPMLESNCLMCSKRLISSEGRRKYCSWKCAGEARKRSNTLRPKLKKRCRTCNNFFDTKTSYKLYCSEHCRWRASNPEVFHKCKICLKTFQATHGAITYCSAKCRKIGYKNIKIAKRHRRRASGEISAKVVADIKEKYGFSCVFCDFKDGDDNSRQISIEHLTPVSRGGTNTAENLVISCIGTNGCNNIKNNRTLIEYLFNFPIIRKRRVKSNVS